MVDNSSCCLEDTYEQRPSQDSQEVLQPAYVLPEAPVRKELIEDVKQVIQEVKEVIQEFKQEDSPSPSKKRLSKNFLKGSSIFDLLEARAKKIGAAKRQRTD